MPHLRIETNVPKDRIPEDAAVKLCSVLSKSLGKPLNVGFIYDDYSNDREKLD